MGLDCDEGAAVFSCLASEAVEVLVVVAEAVSGDFVAEGGAALSAEQAAFEVVGSDGRFLFGVGSAVADGFDF